MHGFVPALTSFVGRVGELDEVAGLLEDRRLVTVTGPGGVGKTRLAGEVARRVAARFADGVWLVELAAVGKPALVPAAVAVALDVHQPTGMSLVEALAGVLARRQLLLVLDNCEHVAAAVAELCGAVLPAADDVRVLATSREPLGIGGEARYRLSALTLPEPDNPGGAAGSEAVALFADRARQADAHVDLGGEAGAAVARLVARLDGMPLAIELAAARVESLGVAQLLDRIDDRFALLADGDRLAAPRQRSLAATVEWSYRLLGKDERRVFRRLAVFPGPFTLEAAEAVAGAGAGPAVLHLVDCSLLVPPRTGPDARTRYLMLETLRAYGLQRLAEAGEQHAAAAALARHALQVAESAAVGLQAGVGELAATLWLDAEDPTTQQALSWALEHDPPIALRLAAQLAPWWVLRGRLAAGSGLLSSAAEHATPGSDIWCTAQIWLGRAADVGGGERVSLGRYTAVRDALAAGAPSPLLIDALCGRAESLVFLGRIPEGVDEARRALALTQEIGYLAGEAYALLVLSMAAFCAGDPEGAVPWARQSCQIDSATITGRLARRCRNALTTELTYSGELAAARSNCADALVLARQAGDLEAEAFCLDLMTELEMREARIPQARATLREALELATRLSSLPRLIDCLGECGYLCAATGRDAEAITIWAAYIALVQATETPETPQITQRRQEPLRKAAQALGSARTRAAEERGAAMTLQTAVEFAAMLTAQDPQTPQPSQGLAQLSARERELVTLVAQGRTDAQIAAQLYISVSTVRSHLERIRDKSGCRRRADLTRLALQAGLV